MANLNHDLTTGQKVLLRRDCRTTRAPEGPAGDRELEFVASTDGIKRDGNRVRNDGWDFTHFAKNPIFLWGHDSGNGYGSPTLPLGRVLKWWTEALEGGATCLKIRVRFATHPLADTVLQLYRENVLSAVSIGWTPLETQPLIDEAGNQCGWDFLRNELLEVSAVPVPSDPDAIMIAARANKISGEQLASFARAAASMTRGAHLLDGREESKMENPLMDSPEKEMPVDGEAPTEDAPVEEDPAEDGTEALGTALIEAEMALEIMREVLASGGDPVAVHDALMELRAAVLASTEAMVALDLAMGGEPAETPEEEKTTEYDEPSEPSEPSEELAARVSAIEALLSGARIGQKVSADRRSKLQLVEKTIAEAGTLLRSVLSESETESIPVPKARAEDVPEIIAERLLKLAAWF